MATQCKLISKVMARVDGELTGTCLGAWDSDENARKYAKSANSGTEKSHPWLEYTVEHEVVPIEVKAMQ